MITDSEFINIKLGKFRKNKMPIRIMLQENVSPSKIIKVSADEMMAIMRRNSAKSYVPAVLHNNAAGASVLSHFM
jgi:hypothetical protein